MVDALGRPSGEQFGGRGRQSPGTIDPLLLADQLASEPERDIQVATVRCDSCQTTDRSVGAFSVSWMGGLKERRHAVFQVRPT